MDCGKKLFLAAGLWAAAAGCQHTTGSVPAPPGVPPAAVKPATPVAAAEPPPKDDGKSKKALKPETYCRFGDFKANEAEAPGATPAMRDLLREEARKSYQYALSLDPRCLAAQRGLARLYTASGDFSRAAAAYQKALEAAPKDAGLWYDLGVCWSRAREYDRAAEALARAAEIDPENKACADTQGVVLARLGRYDESLRCFARAHNEADAHYRFGLTLRKLGLADEARRHLEVAVEKDPNLQTARAVLAELSSPQAPAVQPAGYTAPAGTAPFVGTGVILPDAR
jgi:tetratricopeptide (TPR) repeat protein